MKSLYDFLAVNGYRILLVAGMILIWFLVAVFPR